LNILIEATGGLTSGYLIKAIKDYKEDDLI
jgi:hypothetical protein